MEKTQMPLLALEIIYTEYQIKSASRWMDRWRPTA